MTDLPAGYHRAEQEWLQPPDQPDPITCIFRVSVDLYPDGDESPEGAFKRAIREHDITLSDIDVIECDESDGWPDYGGY